MIKELAMVLKVLQYANGYRVADDISKQVHFSAKKIQTLINDSYTLELIAGFRIESKIGKGYLLQILDQSKFDRFLLDADIKDQDIERVNYVICRLIEENDYLTIESIADEIYVSRSTVDRLIKRIADEIASFDLELKSKPRYGIFIEGTEINKRFCYAHHRSSATTLNGLSSDIADQIRLLLSQIFLNEHFEISDAGFNNLVYHIQIALRRVSAGHAISGEIGIDFQDQIDDERKIACNIVKEIAHTFKVELPSSEIDYIIIHLLGKKILGNEQLIHPAIFTLIDDIFEVIHTKAGIDFNSDFELKTMMAMHIQPMLSRIRFGLKQSNPILIKVKREMNKGYELALLASDVIFNTLKMNVGDDEVSYLALHLELALERQHLTSRHRKVIVVCSSGRGTANLIKYRLMKRYDIKEEDIMLSDSMHLDQIDQSRYACILSTVPIQSVQRIPVILIDATMDAQSNQRIEAFFGHEANVTLLKESGIIRSECLINNVELDKKDAILKLLCEALKSSFKLDDSLYNDVLKREALSSTEVGNFTALPHPLNNPSDQLLLAIAILKKPIMWKNTEVKIIFLIALPKKETELSKLINDGISRIVCDPQLMVDLEDHFTLESVISILSGE